MTKRILFIITCCMLALAGYAQHTKVLTLEMLREGDLLFCAQSRGNSITDVTQGVGGLKIDHVAILHRVGKRAFALEAIHMGVCLTPIDSFLSRRETVVAARLRDTVGVARSVERAMKYLGRPYDFNFMPDDSAMYCSELVQKSYRRTDGTLVFQPIPMSFHDKTGTITPYWKDYYARQGLQVPEGKPGSNPGDLSRSKAVAILGELKK